MSHPTFRIALGADHGAVDLKNAVVSHLKAVGHEVRDFGTDSHESVDYPDYANLVARNVADGTYDFGILACTSGVGMSIAANRHRHVRAANVRSVEEATITRQHNDANVLCLSGKHTDAETAMRHGRCLPRHRLRRRPPRAARLQILRQPHRSRPIPPFTPPSPPRNTASATTSN